MQIEPVTAEQASLARRAYRQYGKGHSPTRLKYGDCFSYALFKACREYLLFVGRDFAQTDLAPLPPPE